MIGISDNVRLVLWMITGISSAILSILLVLLENDIRYFILGRRGRRPTRKPALLWLWLFLLMGITVIGTAIASSAPSTTETPPFTLPDLVIDIAPSTIVVASTISSVIILIIVVVFLMKQQAIRVQKRVENLKNKESAFFQVVTSDFQSLFEERF